MGDSAIEWTDKTWNPVRGCTRVSEGCRHCYAERQAARFSKHGQPYHGIAQVVAPRDLLDRVGGRRNGWTGEVRFIPERLADPIRWKKPSTIFVDSMSDLFHEKMPDEQIAAVFGVMAACPQHTFIILTKRARRMREWFEWIDQVETPYVGLPVYSDHVRQRQVCCRYAWMLPDSEERVERGEVYGTHPSDAILEHQRGPWPLPNVIIGVSVENRATISRLDDLRACPASVRLISAEPLLEDLGKVDLSGIGWLIAGCESGPSARPCEVDWLRSLRDQCAAAEVPFFLKQARETRLGVCGDSENPNGDKPCGKPVTAYVIDHDTAAYSCGCTAEGSELGAGVPLGEGEGSKRKPGGIIGAPYLDGVPHLAFPEVRR